VVAIFARRLLAGEPTRINGDGRQTRDFVFVKDVAEANALALESSEAGSFNVGTGRETDINTVFAILKRLTGSGLPEQHGPALAGEQKRSVVDARKLREKLGWAPRTDLESGLKATVDYFRTQASPRQVPALPG
jgi:UDP-glucose 4-epimerase